MKYYSLNIFGKRVVYQVSLIEHPKNVFIMESVEFYDISDIDEMIEAINIDLKGNNSNKKLEIVFRQKLLEEKQNRRYKKIRKLI